MAVVLALVLSIFSNSVALAAESDETVSYGSRYGHVTAVSSSIITIENFGGTEKNILVDSKTKYYAANGAKKSLSNISSGTWLFASGTVDSSGNLEASVIVLTGSKYTTKDYWSVPREYGTVISVNRNYGVFFLNTAKSGLVKVIVYDLTKYLNNKVRSVSKIKVGMRVVVSGPRQSNGYILANIVDAFKPGAKR